MEQLPKELEDFIEEFSDKEYELLKKKHYLFYNMVNLIEMLKKAKMCSNTYTFQIFRYILKRCKIKIQLPTFTILEEQSIIEENQDFWIMIYEKYKKFIEELLIHFDNEMLIYYLYDILTN